MNARKIITAGTIVLGSVLAPVAVFAQDVPTQAVDDDDDDGDKAGLWGLLGLAGLAGLKRKQPPVYTTTPRPGTGTGDVTMRP